MALPKLVIGNTFGQSESFTRRRLTVDRLPPCRLHSLRAMVQSRWKVVAVFCAGIVVGFILSNLTGSNAPSTAVTRAAGVEEFKALKSLPKVPTYAEHLASSSYTEIEDAYYKRLDGVHLKCNNAPHIGRGGDGGWEVCMAPPYKPQQPCLVYTFGVNNVWEFDESMARDYGCKVRAFDPSMSVNDHVHQPGPVNFYKIGLGGSNRKLPNGWQLLTFQSLLTRFGEADRTIDLVKIDIEYSEWEAFESMLETGVFLRTKQLLFETHTNEVNGAISTKSDFLRYHKIMDAIESLGFRRFFRHDNHYGVGAVAGARGKSNDPILLKSKILKRTCCHEVYYVNMRFAKDMSGFAVV